MQGSAVQGFLGKQLADMQSGQFVYQGMFGSNAKKPWKWAEALPKDRDF